MLITLVFCVEVLILRETDGWKIGVKEGNLGPFPHYWLHWQFSMYPIVELGIADLTVNNLLGYLVGTLLLSDPFCGTKKDQRHLKFNTQVFAKKWSSWVLFWSDLHLFSAITAERIWGRSNISLIQWKRC